MPIIKSAKKRVRVAEQAAIRNSKTKRNIRTAVKSLQAAIEKKDAKKVNELLRETQSAIDTAAKKNIMHKNKAARKKAAVAKIVKDSGIKLTTSAKPAAKPAAKKPATKAKAAPKKAPAKK